ncbi:hypothetical protein B0H11DRAFT_1763767, partial [Mycena galericulata]
PKKGYKDYVKHPENVFILLRRKCCEDRPHDQPRSPLHIHICIHALLPPLPTRSRGQRRPDLCKTILQWKALAKKKHGTLHPNYVYRPQACEEPLCCFTFDNDDGRKEELGAAAFSTDRQPPTHVRPARAAEGVPAQPLHRQQGQHA